MFCWCCFFCCGKCKKVKSKIGKSCPDPGNVVSADKVLKTPILSPIPIRPIPYAPQLLGMTAASFSTEALLLDEERELDANRSSAVRQSARPLSGSPR